MRFPGNYITFCFLGHECELFVYLAFGKMLKIHRYHLDCFLYLLYSNGKGITRTTNVAMIMGTCSLVVNIFRVAESKNDAMIWNT